MYTGTLPATSIWGTWSENIEVWDVDSDDLMDLSEVTEITLNLIDPKTGVPEITATMTEGDIVIPSMGIIQWHISPTVMGFLSTKLYEVVLLLEDGTDTVPLILGRVSIVE